eukprot:TRINITY_DN6492_c0_g1_i1.p1 TRINITY_DN6492_c0_g1~~TRINITY_DN6492_c0_g1_i1.p1  ORF type:complete len:398 (-),score=68.53 TRINITY_DN6492_c0_g1_i1:87-1280(-)
MGQRVFSETEKQNIKHQMAQGNQEFLEIPEQQIGVPRATKGRWASCLRILEPIELKTLSLLELENNEAAFSIYITSFAQRESELFVLVGTVKDYVHEPRSHSGGFIHTYKFSETGAQLELVHKTPVEDIPYSFCNFKGRLLVSIGNLLRIYDLGKKKLLKKCEYRHFMNPINTINVFGERIFCTDMADSFHVMRYKSKDNQLFEFADDVLPRWITAACVLDYWTVCGADKFENVFICRLPKNVDEDIDEDPLSYKFKWETGYLNGAAFKMEQICNFYTGDLITCLLKTSLVSTSQEVILYGTSSGSIGAFYPFETREDIDFFLHMEMYLRIEALPLCGRDHMGYRSSYGPVKNVIDGDLCEQFSRLDYGKQKVLSEELDRTPAEVLKKLEDIRNRIL